jgi:lipooligosaccharide transport system permease protein
VFVAPALLASSAMNGAVFDTTGNVFFKLKYARLYDSVLATPLGPARRGRRRGRLGAAAGSVLRRDVPVVMALAGRDDVVGAARAARAVLVGLAFAGGDGGDDLHAHAGRTSTSCSSRCCRCSCSRRRSIR